MGPQGTPWMGIRSSTYQDLYVSSPTPGSGNHLYPRTNYYYTPHPNLQDTGVYSAFVQDLGTSTAFPPQTYQIIMKSDEGGVETFCEDVIKNSFDDFTATGIFADPYENTLKWPGVANGPTIGAFADRLPSFYYPEKRLVRCRMESTTAGPTGLIDSETFSFTGGSGNSIHVKAISTWKVTKPSTSEYYIEFFTDSDLNSVKADLIPGPVSIDYFRGYSEEDNLALSLVHGDPSTPWTADPSYGYGVSGEARRDIQVFQIEPRTALPPGATMRTRQYWITDQFSNIDARSRELVPEAIMEIA